MLQVNYRYIFPKEGQQERSGCKESQTARQVRLQRGQTARKFRQKERSESKEVQRVKKVREQGKLDSKEGLTARHVRQ
jgi:hypothetical protein